MIFSKLLIALVLLSQCTRIHSLDEHHGVKVASFKFEYVKTELILTMFIVLIGIFKLGGFFIDKMSF